MLTQFAGVVWGLIAAGFAREPETTRRAAKMQIHAYWGTCDLDAFAAG